VIVDRVEDGTAVVEIEGRAFEVPGAWLPIRAREGTVLRIEIRREGDATHIVLAPDPEGQAAREAEIRRIRDGLPEGPDGDIVL